MRLPSWAAGEQGSQHVRDEFWLMFQRPDGKVLRWMSFSSLETALGAIPDADRTVRAVRWGVKEVRVTHEVTRDTQWQVPQ